MLRFFNKLAALFNKRGVSLYKKTEKSAAKANEPRARRSKECGDKRKKSAATACAVRKLPSLPPAPPKVEGKKAFHDFELPPEVMCAIGELGFQYCTPIQAKSLAHTLAGENIAGRAQTGTGKTAAFVIAILARYLRSPEKRSDAPGKPRALVIAPTRELCVQICDDAKALGKYCDLRICAVFGGMDYSRQQRELLNGRCDLLIATPGRLLDFIRGHVVDLSHIDTFVIDEADRMLDMGFIPDVRKIVRNLPANTRQTMLWSATLNDDILRLAQQWMRDPVKIEIEPEHVTAGSIQQVVYITTATEKFTLLCNLLKRYEGQRVLIFANRRISTERLALQLRRQGFSPELLSGDVRQERRMRIVNDFKEGKIKTVVATDVAGRGLHITDIALVINFELPYEAEDYVHRIGRTGRAGQVGTAVSFACEDESFVIPDIEKYIGEELKCAQPDDYLLTPLPPPVNKHGAQKERDDLGLDPSAKQGRSRKPMTHYHSSRRPRR